MDLHYRQKPEIWNAYGEEGRRISEAGKNVKIIIGGNAVNAVKDRWQWFNADGYAPDAQQAIILANKLIA